MHYCCLHDTTTRNWKFLLVYIFDTNFYRKCPLYYFFSARPLDQKLGSSLYIFHLHTTIRHLHTTIQPFSHLFFLCTRPFDQKLVSSLIYFFYLYMTIRSKLGVTLKFIIFLIEPIFCLQYCLYISSATIIPLYFVHYIHRSAALIFRTLYPWLYEVFATLPLCFVFPVWK